MKELKRILSYLKPYKKEVCGNVLFNFLYVIAQAFSLVLVAPFIGVLFGIIDPVMENPGLSLRDFDFDQAKIWFYFHVTQIKQTFGLFSALLFVAGLFVFSSLLSNLFRYLGMCALIPLRNGVVKDFRNELFRKILALPLSFFSEQRRGDLISRMTNDVAEIDWGVTKALQSLIKDFINIVVFLVLLFKMNIELTLIVLVILPPTAYIVDLIGKSLKRNSDRLQAKLGVMISLLEESISGLRMIKSYGVFNQMNARFSAVHDDYTRYNNKIARRSGLSNPVTELLVVIAIVFVIWFGGDQVLQEKLSPEALITFLVLFLRLLPPAKAFAGAFFLVQRGRAAMQRIFVVLDAQERIVEIENPVKWASFKDSIVYDNISFAYHSVPEKNVLKAVSLELKKGKTLAIVGPSGGGKSTLVDLLPRFQDGYSGEIRVDGISIRDLSLADLRGKIGIVSQQSVLFNDTILNNITFGRQSVSLEDVERAAKIANAHEFITAMPQGYHSQLSDNGTNLSGGQRQRLNIARAVLHDPDILILDEATSALDTESEHLVQESLKALMKDRTVMVVAHRLSTIQHADEIIVIDNGEIVEKGTHTELVNAGGLYRRLVDLQTFS